MKLTLETQKVNTSTIMRYMNAPLIASFEGTKDIITKLIISRYHNGNFYFDKTVEISDEVIYKLTGLSNKSKPIPLGSNPGLVEKLIGTPTRKNSKGLVIIQIKATTPKIVTKIICT